MMIVMLALLTVAGSIGGGIRYRENFLDEVLGDLEDIRESIDNDNPMEDMHFTQNDLDRYGFDEDADVEPPLEVETIVEREKPPDSAKPPEPDFAKKPPVKKLEHPVRVPPAPCAANRAAPRAQGGAQVRAWEPGAMEFALVK